MAFRCSPHSPPKHPNSTVEYSSSTVGNVISTFENSSTTMWDSNATVVNLNCMLSDETYWWVECPVIGLLCVVGLIANSLALMVWRSSREHRHSLFLLQALAITDNFYLLIALFVLPIQGALPELSDSFKEISPLTIYLFNTAQSLCILMIVLVTVERYIYVCHPFQASQTLRATRKFWLVGLVYAFSFLYNLPYVVCYCVEEVRDNPNFAYYRKKVRPGVNSDLLKRVYEQGLRFVLMFLLPLLTLAVMSRRLVHDIHNVRRQETTASICETGNANLEDNSENGGCDSFIREDSCAPQHASRGSTNQYDSKQHHVTSFRLRLYPPNQVSQSQNDSSGRKITTLLIIIVCIFMVCQSLEMIYIFINFLPLDLCTLLKVDVIAPISHVLLVVNSSANFFVYFIFGNQFRKSFFGMMRLRHF